LKPGAGDDEPAPGQTIMPYTLKTLSDVTSENNFSDPILKTTLTIIKKAPYGITILEVVRGLYCHSCIIYI